MLSVSLKQTIVNPDHPVWQAGGATRTQKARGVYSDVKVMALTLKINQKWMILTTVDATALETKDVEDLQEQISAATGIDQEAILIVATHTHSAPALKESSSTSKQVDEGYKRSVFAALVDTAVSSAQSCQEATAYAQTGELIGYYGNRDQKEKEGDQSACLLTFRDQAGKVIAALVQLHCHPTFLDQSWLMISADLAGALREALGRSLGVEPMFVCGVTGDMSSRYWRKSQDYFTLEKSAQEMADRILKFRPEKPLELNTLRIEQVEKHIHHPVNLIDLKNKLDRYLQQQKTETDPIEQRLLATKIRNARASLDSGETEIDLMWKTSIITLGDLQLVTFNNDPVVYFGKQIKAASSKKLCLTLNHVNGEVGYLVEKSDYQTGYIGNVTKALPGEAEEYIAAIVERVKQI